jgi:hypothetical protein
VTVNRVVSESADVAYDPALAAPPQKVTATSTDVAYDPNLAAPLQRLTAVSLDVAYAQASLPPVFWRIG